MIRKYVWFLLAVFIVAVWSFTVYAQEQKSGAELFEANKCSKCHKYQAPEPDAVPVEGGPPNLYLVGDRHDAEWMAQFLRKEIDQNGAMHKIAWKGAPDELVVLTEWLATLKSFSDTTSSVVIPDSSGQ